MIEIHDIKALTYEGRLLGLRFYTNKGIYDADRDSLKNEGILNINIPNRSELKLVGDLLVTDEEINSGKTVIDVSEDEKLKVLVNFLRGKEKFTHLFKFQKPYEQSLKTFMEDPYWVPERVERNDEYRNQHVIKQPDGKYWRGGWIGRYRSLELAKEGFHYEQCKWALHRGDDVADEALITYLDLRRAKKYITQVEKSVSFNGDECRVLVDGVVHTFNLSDFPKDRISQRGFVSEHNLISKNIEGVHLFDARETVIVGIQRAIYKHKGIVRKDPYYA